MRRLAPRIALAAIAAPLIGALAGPAPADDEAPPAPAVREVFRVQLEADRTAGAAPVCAVTLGARTAFAHAKTIQVLERETGNLERKIETPDGGHVVRLTPVAESHLAVLTTAGLFLADVATGEVAWKSDPVPNARLMGPRAAGFAAQGDQLWAAKDETTVVRIDEKGVARDVPIGPLDGQVAKAQGDRRNKFALKTRLEAGPMPARRQVFFPIDGGDLLGFNAKGKHKELIHGAKMGLQSARGPFARVGERFFIYGRRRGDRAPVIAAVDLEKGKPTGQLVMKPPPTSITGVVALPARAPEVAVFTRPNAGDHYVVLPEDRDAKRREDAVLQIPDDEASLPWAWHADRLILVDPGRRARLRVVTLPDLKTLFTLSGEQVAAICEGGVIFGEALYYPRAVDRLRRQLVRVDLATGVSTDLGPEVPTRLRLRYAPADGSSDGGPDDWQGDASGMLLADGESVRRVVLAAPEGERPLWKWEHGRVDAREEGLPPTHLFATSGEVYVVFQPELGIRSVSLLELRKE